MRSTPKTPTLEGPLVRLETLSLAHLPALELIAFDPTNWQFMMPWITTPAELRAMVEETLAAVALGTVMPWVTVVRGQGGQPDVVAGATRFSDLSLRHLHTELGFTWLAQPYRGTLINSAVKLLQLSYGFEELGLRRIAFKTHHEHARSQAALRKLGAVYEGTFRNHFIMPDGSQRHSVWFSIIREEWPLVKAGLVAKLGVDAGV